MVKPPARMVLSAALLLSGCGLVDSEPEFEIRIGEMGSIPVQVPDAAQVGAGFAVSVFTLGGCGDTVERTDVEVLDGLVTIIPYDRHEVTGDRVCLGVLTHMEHTVIVSFNVPGTAEILVITRDGVTDEMVEHSFFVTVE